VAAIAAAAVALALSIGVATQVVPSSVAGAATNPVAASWSSSPNCSTFVTATPPAGTVSATVTVNGGGGGGGNTNSGSGGSGGTGAQITGTFALTHNTGAVSVKLGCGGSPGTTGGGGGTTISGASGGSGFGSGGSSGGATDEDVSVDGVASGGGGGGASGLCFGTTGCTTPVAVAAGGGGGGARWDCTGSTGPGSGGAGQSGGSGAVSNGGGGSNGDGSDGGGGGGGTSSGGGGGGSGDSSGGSTGGNAPYSSSGGGGGGGGGGFPVEAGASGGGGGGGYTGGGGGGGDECTSGSDAGGGGGGGASAANSTYASSISYNGSGGGGGGSAAAGASGSITLTWNVDNLSVTSPGNQSNTSGTAISGLTIAAPHDTTGGNSVTFAATGLPAGLTINSGSGAITGTPTTACTCSVTVTATDSESLSANTSFTWTVSNTVTVANPGAQSHLSGSAISTLSNSATDSSSTATISSWTASGLPAGLSINASSGAITGTPTTACACSVTVHATDSAGFTGSASFTWTISNTVSVTSPGNQSDVSGTAISPVTVSAHDSSAGATLTYSATGLPAGLSINSSTGAISGMPTTACTCSVTAKATDNAGYTGSVPFTWTITNTVTETNPGNQSNLSGTAITPVGAAASDTSSTATLSYSAGGTLPPGLSVNASSGVISGTPNTAGTYSVTITATDNAGFDATASFTWTVTNTVSVTNPGSQSDISGSAITAVPVVASDSSSTATLTYSAGSSLPPGLSIDSSTGVISGTPTVAGSFSVTVTVTDNAGFVGSTSFTWTITNTVSVTNPGDQNDVSGSAITPLQIEASDSVQSATLSYSDNGTLPAGLSIDPSTGLITGTPTTGGESSVTITVTDSSNFAAEVTFDWTITNTVSVTNPGAQSDGSGSAITPLPVPASDSSSVATLSYSDGGTLPPGLSIDPSTGTVSGTPTTAGTYSVTVTALDNAGFTGSAAFTWTITNTVTVTNPGAQSDVSGSAIGSLSIAASDSASGATLSYGATGLPAGLSISHSSGVISGTPTTGGRYSVVVTATDNAGFNGSASFTWTITNTVTVTSPGNQTGTVGSHITPVSVPATDSSSTATVTYAATGLPSGLSINTSTGSITGSLTTSGSYSVTVTATDNAGYSGSASFTWTVVGPVITGVKPSSGGAGTKVSVSGSGLAGATSVKFGSVAATSFSVNAKGTKLTVTAPAESAGTVDIVVTTAEGPTLPTASDHFTFVTPAVTKVSPKSGLTSGGNKVKIKGSGFNGATTVDFGSVPATSFAVNAKGTQITVTAPAHSAGVVDITVITPAGTSSVTNADLYTFN
jgi:hypothetical protein